MSTGRPEARVSVQVAGHDAVGQGCEIGPRAMRRAKDACAGIAFHPASELARTTTGLCIITAERASPCVDDASLGFVNDFLRK